MEEKTKVVEKKNNPWSWIPSLYFAEGLPYIIVITISVIMYKRLGISNGEIALYTSWLYLPWVIKPLWSPIVDVLKTKRFWITIMQLIIGAGLAGVALTIPMPDFMQFTLVFFWLIAFSSATHDIAADGFYMLGLSESQQSVFIGIRSAFYRFALIAGQFLLVLLAGYLEGTISVHAAEVKVMSSPSKFFEETIKVDSVAAKELSGNLRLIANPSTLEISTRPMTKEQVNFYLNFTKTLNVMNGFSRTTLEQPDTTDLQALVGNIGIVKLYLSKKPGVGDEHVVNFDFKEGNEGIKVLVGKGLHFNSNNWNKPAFAIVQLDSSIAKSTEAVFKAQTDKIPMAWVITMFFAAGLYVFFFIYHRLILPKPANDKPAGTQRMSSIGKEFFRSFARFFEKKNIIVVILFLLLYNLAEAQLVKMSSLFLLDNREVGGLGLSTTDIALIYSWVGVISLVLGGILGGFAVAKKGLKYWLWPMLVAINLPDIIYVYMAFFQPSNMIIIYLCVAIESFGYGFGFTFYMMYMIYVSQGEYKTSHFAIATGFMALGMMIPGMISGFIQEAIGYKMFFIWIMISTIPGFIIAKFIPLEYGFGKKKLTETN